MSRGIQREILEQKLLNDIYSFNIHQKLISLLESDEKSNFSELHKARENFSNVFSQPPAFYKGWITGVQQNADEFDNVQEIIVSLFEKCINDFPADVGIWSNYVRYMEHVKTPKDKLKELFIRGIAAVQYDNMKGASFWKLYIEYLQKDEQEEELEDDDFVELLVQRLQVPSCDLQNVWNEFCGFEESEEGRNRGKVFYEVSKKIYEDELNFEQKVSDTSRNLLGSFGEYISYRKKYNGDVKQCDLKRVISLYERCLIHYPLVESLWMDYLRFLHSKKVEGISKAFVRALRCCPKSCDLWIQYLTYVCGIFSDDPKDESRAFEIYQRSLSIGVQNGAHFGSVFLIYCNRLRKVYQRRKKKNADHEKAKEFFEATMEQAVSYLSLNFPNYDSKCALERFWAEVEAFDFGNLENARKMFEKLIERRAHDSSIWIYYIQLEKKILHRKLEDRDVSKVRNLHERAVKNVNDKNRVKSISNEWVMFEILNGEASDVENAKFASYFRLQQMGGGDGDERGKRKKRRQHQNQTQRQNRQHGQQGQRGQQGQQGQRGQQGQHGQRGKRKREFKKAYHNHSEIIRKPDPTDISSEEPPKKRQKVEEKESKTEECSKDEGKEGKTEDGSKVEGEEGKTEEGSKEEGNPIKLLRKKQRELMEKERKERHKKIKDSLRGAGNDNLTCFAWNLDFTVTEEELQQFFLDNVKKMQN